MRVAWAPGSPPPPLPLYSRVVGLAARSLPAAGAACRASLSAHTRHGGHRPSNLQFCRIGWGVGRDALEGEGPQRRPQKRLGRRLEEVAKSVGGGYCRLQMPLNPAPWRGVGGGYLPPFQCIRGGQRGQTAAL